MKRSGVFFFFVVAFAAGAAAAPRSNHLTRFDLGQCHPAGCFRARAALAYVSQTGESFTARDVELEIDPAGSAAKEHRRCGFFRYDLVSQDLTCDNRDVANAKEPTLTIDRRFVIHRY